MERKLLNVDQLAEYLGVGRSKAYQLVNSETFYPAIRLGKVIRVSADALDQWIAEQTKGA